MASMRKITLEVPEDLLAGAQRATGKGISETVREGLRQLSVAEACDRLLALAGKVDFGVTWEELKDDR